MDGTQGPKRWKGVQESTHDMLDAEPSGFPSSQEDNYWCFTITGERILFYLKVRAMDAFSQKLLKNVFT